jgi:hypothetical protein
VGAVTHRTGRGKLVTTRGSLSVQAAAVLFGAIRVTHPAVDGRDVVLVRQVGIHQVAVTHDAVEPAVHRLAVDLFVDKDGDLGLATHPGHVGIGVTHQAIVVFLSRGSRSRAENQHDETKR